MSSTSDFQAECKQTHKQTNTKDPHGWLDATLGPHSKM